MNKTKKKYKLKNTVKTALAIICIWFLIVAYLFLYCERIENLNENSYTEEGHAKTLILYR